MANTLYSKGYFSNNGLFIDTYPIVACDVEFVKNEDDNLPVVEVEEYSGGRWVYLDYESGEYYVVLSSFEGQPQHIQITIPSAKNKLYRVKYKIQEVEDSENPCDGCAGCIDDNFICRAYINTDSLRDATLNLINNMCSDSCDVPYNLVNKILELFSIEIAASKENNCAAVAKLYDKYMLKLDIGGGSTDCGCHD